MQQRLFLISRNAIANGSSKVYLNVIKLRAHIEDYSHNMLKLFVCVCVCSLRGIKVEQRTLNDNASSLVDMAKVGSISLPSF